MDWFKKIIVGVIAFTLAFPLSLIPVPTKAAETSSIREVEPLQNQSITGLSELTAERTQNTRIFDQGNGKKIAQVSTGNLNFKDSAGQWAVIDNNLERFGDIFQNKANSYKATFKKQAENELVKISKNNVDTSMSIDGAKLSEAVVKDNKITYKNVLPNIDIKYTTLDESVNEDIIVNAKPEINKLKFTLATGAEITAETTADGDIVIKNAGKTIWFLGRPSVINRVTGDPVFDRYELQKVNGKYEISFSIAKFLPSDEMGYPITIDPTFTIPTEDESAMALQGQPDVTFPMSSANTTLQVGKTSYQEARSYLKFSLPNLSGATIDGAMFGITCYEERSSITRIKLFRVQQSWSASSLSWNNQPGLAGTAESSFAANTAYAWWNYDITQLVKDWYGGTPNYGIALKAHDPSISRRNFLTKYSITTSFKPYVLISYDTNPTKKILGVKDWWRYVKTDLAGPDSLVNIATGNHAMTFEDISNDGRGLDTIISHTYNSDDTYVGRFGYGWTISANKRLLPSSDRKTVTYIDETGTSFVFNDTDGNGNYVDSDGDLDSSSGFYVRPNHRPNGLNWGLKYDAGSARYIGKSNGRMTYTFDSNGKILEERDRNGNALTYNYDSQNRLVNVTDASGRQAELFYNTSGLLNRIEDHNFNDSAYVSYGGKVLFDYSNGDLTKVTYYSGSTIIQNFSFSYLNHKISGFVDSLNNKTVFNYDSQKRVFEIIDPLGKKTSINYVSTNQTQVISPRGNESGVTPTDYATDYYFTSNPYFHFGIVNKEISPPSKNDQGQTARKTTEYDYSDDFMLTAETDPTGAVEASAYDDISGLNTYQYSKLKYQTLKNSYSYSTYDNPAWNLLDSYNANGVQTSFYYDANGNLTRKGVIDGDGINLLHNPGFESVSRRANVWDSVCGFKHDTFPNIGDYWCTGGTSDNKLYTIENSAATDGLRSQIIGYIGNTKVGSVNVYQEVDESTPTLANSDYVLTYKYKQEGASNAPVQMAIEHYDTTGDIMGSTIIYPDSAWNTGWTSGQLTFHTPSEASYWTTNIYMRIKSPSTGVYSKTWFDSVKLEKGTTPSAQTEKITTFTYNQYGQPLTETTPEGKVNNYSWDANGNMVSVSDPAGNLTSFTYDANGNKLSKTEPKGNATPTDPNDFKTVFNYNGQNKIVTTTEAKTGQKTVYYYDKNGNLYTSVTPNGIRTTYLFDTANRMTETLNYYGYRSKIQYDANGNPKGVTDPNKASSANNYDPTDRLEKETDPAGKQTEYNYDNTDNVKNIAENGMNLSYNYDAEGKVTAESSNHSGATKSINYSYDKNGNLTTTTDQSGTSTANTYSATEEISKVTIAGQVTAYTRNKNNQLTKVDSANGDQANYSYNQNGMVTDTAYSRGGTNFQSYSNEYDQNGNKTKITANDVSGTQVNQYEYDNQNQLVKKTAPEGVSTYTYNPSSGSMTKSVTPSATSTYNYDGNRLYYKTSNGQYEFYGYDANGNLTSRDTGDRVNALLHFDDNLVNTRDNLAPEKTGTVNFVTGKFGKAAEVTNNSYLSYSSASNISTLGNTIEFWFKPNWNSDGSTRTLMSYYLDANNFVKITKNADNNLQFYIRRTGVDYKTVTTTPINWTAGNWYHMAFTQQPKNSAIFVNGAKVAEKNFCAVGPAGCTGTVPALFLNGEKIVLGANFTTTASEFADGTFDEYRSSSVILSAASILADFQTSAPFALSKTTGYQYDSKDRLVKVTKPDATTVSYTYDAQDRLTKRSQNGQADINYLYDGDKIVAETANDGTVLTKYFYDAEGALVMIGKNNQNYFPVYDGLGGIVKIRDSAGTTISSYNYDDWGKLLSKTEAFANPIRFAGYWYDETISLYHLGARWYDPSLYRFISVDPHPGDQDDSLSLNEYVYCKNNPVNYSDPDGDFIETGLDIASVIYSAHEFKKKKSWGNFGWLAFDAIMLALPIAPASGVVRAGLKAGNGGKVAIKAVEKIEMHHEIPKYLGGAVKQKLIPLAKSLHKEVTNAFRKEVQYGSQQAKNLRKLSVTNPSKWKKAVKPILKKVYKKFTMIKKG